jgi:hypothetical protein
MTIESMDNSVGQAVESERACYERILRLHLKGKRKQRYLAMRAKVRRELANGTRAIEKPKYFAM